MRTTPTPSELKIFSLLPSFSRRDLIASRNLSLDGDADTLLVEWRGLRGESGVASAERKLIPRLTFAADVKPPLAIRFQGSFLDEDPRPTQVTLKNGATLSFHYHALSDLSLPASLPRELGETWSRGPWFEPSYIAPILTSSPEEIFSLSYNDHVSLALYALETGMTHLLCGGTRYLKTPQDLRTIAEFSGSVSQTVRTRREAGPIPRELYFGGAKPHSQKIISYIDHEVDLSVMPFVQHGKARLVAGGAEAFLQDTYAGVSGFTLTGGRPHQEDSLAYAHFTTQGGDVISYGVVADGVGSHALGEMASSAFCQGSHAALLLALYNERLPRLEDLHDQGSQAVIRQTVFHSTEIEADEDAELPTPDTVATSVLIVNGEITIAASGDSPLFLFVVEGNTVRLEGYTDVAVAPDKCILNSARERQPKLYRAMAKPGSVLIAMSDGLAGSLIENFEFYLSEEIRRHSNRSIPHRDLFKIFERILEVVPAHDFAAAVDHLIHHPLHPLQEHPEFAQTPLDLHGIVLPPPVRDNRTLLVMTVPQGNSKALSGERSLAHRPLERVRDGVNSSERVTSPKGMQVVKRPG